MLKWVQRPSLGQSKTCVYFLAGDLFQPDKVDDQKSKLGKKNYFGCHTYNVIITKAFGEVLT